MLFNSIEYFLFLPIVFALYWILRKQLTLQNALVLIASYIFYAVWDWRFLSLIILSSVVDFFIGKSIYTTEDQKAKKRLLYISLVVNLGILFTFKYFDFFVGSFVDLANNIGIQANWTSLNWIIPIGISFYTFQTLSYTIDIYKERMKPTFSLLEFSAYVAFFPQLVAGPIERAANLLPQFGITRTFNYKQAVDGSRQILWGMFKKVVIADNCSVFVEAIFNNQIDLFGPILLLGGILFVIQIYCDFSGYSDIAIGSARLLGFELKQNFANPYFSVNSTEFWRRWHISMSTWFRDYVYQPLAIMWRTQKKLGIYLATFVTFTIIGLWHGANWTYIAFGVFQAIVLMLEIYTLKRRKKFKKKKKFLGLYKFVSWFLTMSFWVFLCIIFRSESIEKAFYFVGQMVFTSTNGLVGDLLSIDQSIMNLNLVLIGFGFVILVEYLNRAYDHGLKRLGKFGVLRYPLYFLLVNFVFHNLTSDQAFIYFQF